MMQAINNFKLEEYNDISYGLGRDKQAINLQIEKDIITISLNDIYETFGRRYIKGINSSNNTFYLQYGDNIGYNPSYTHNHPVEDTDNGACIDGTDSEPNGYDPVSITPKYYIIGNKRVIFSKIFNIPTGTILLAKNKKDIEENYLYIDNKYLYIGASSDGGNLTHTHSPSRTYNTSDCGINWSVPWDPMTSVSNEIPDRTELFLFTYNNTYYKDKDIINIGDMVLQDASFSIPSNYSSVSISGSGLLRFANSVSDIGVEGGTTEHYHDEDSPSDANVGPNEGYYITGNSSTSNHMPEYKAVRIIKRES